jgi:DNA replication ATP-dependent helicase Dna2
MEHTRQLMTDLRQFVEAEHKASLKSFFEIWEKSLKAKINTGETQEIKSVRRFDSNHLTIILGENESRFREGDMIRFHSGNPLQEPWITNAVIEEDNEDEWLVRVYEVDADAVNLLSHNCFADPDTMNLKGFYDQSLDDIATSATGRDIILPLFMGQLDTEKVDDTLFDSIKDLAEKAGFNDDQQDAVALGVASEYLACIQGPPGTGKTKVIGHIAKLLVDRGERVLLSSHTHMAINNALNKVADHGVPVAKIGVKGSDKSLEQSVLRFSQADDWEARPDKGYVIGATPFATCTDRLSAYEFDTIIFDEASQVTLPLAIMAMRKGKRFIFVGDHKQLPPVILSNSVLSDQSAFSRLVTQNKETGVMLKETYRLSHALSRWPSKQYYQDELISSGDNKNRKFSLPKDPATYSKVLSSDIPFVFIPSPGSSARNQNLAEAQLVAGIVQSAVLAGLSETEIGIVSPFRRQGKSIRSLLRDQYGIFSAQNIVADTVERMQGQEKEMIIVSLCATQPQYIKAVSDFLFQPERLNVSITRPKTKLILIGPELSDGIGQSHDTNKVTKSSIDAYRSLISHAYQILPEVAEHGTR